MAEPRNHLQSPIDSAPSPMDQSPIGWVRIRHDRKRLMIVPVRTGQFDPPDGATRIEWTL